MMARGKKKSRIRKEYPVRSQKSSQSEPTGLANTSFHWRIRTENPIFANNLPT